MSSRVFVLLGSNVGDSRNYLLQAKKAIEQSVGKIFLESSLYRTAPWGNTDQQDFYNQVLAVETNATPQQCLARLLQIEQDMGRVRHEKWAPRTIDIDMLFFDALVLNEPDLVVPHPLLHERRFTLEPLCEIAPELIHPVWRKSVRELLALCEDPGSVEKL